MESWAYSKGTPDATALIKAHKKLGAMVTPFMRELMISDKNADVSAGVGMSDDKLLSSLQDVAELDEHIANLVARTKVLVSGHKNRRSILGK